MTCTDTSQGRIVRVQIKPTHGMNRLTTTVVLSLYLANAQGPHTLVHYISMGPHTLVHYISIG